MSSSEDENLSDLEDQQAVNESGSDSKDADKPDLKGILDDVEETTCSWKDLVNFFKYLRPHVYKYLFSYLGPD